LVTDKHSIPEVFGSVNDTNYTDIISAKDLTQIERADALKTAGFQDGVLYYFENISPKEKQVEGYWSTSANPGQPLWPSSPDAPGSDWGWEHNDPPFKIEISRYSFRSLTLMVLFATHPLANA
jgi:hypothetical protein